MREVIKMLQENGAAQAPTSTDQEGGRGTWVGGDARRTRDARNRRGEDQDRMEAPTRGSRAGDRVPFDGDDGDAAGSRREHGRVTADGPGPLDQAITGESTEPFFVSRLGRRPTSTIRDESTFGYRPYHLKTSPPTFSGSTSDFLTFERKFMRYAQRHDFSLALHEETEIRLTDTSVTHEDLLRRGYNYQRVRRAHHAWQSLLEAAGTEAVEYLIENSGTPANAWSRLRSRYAPSILNQIAAIQRFLHEKRMAVDEDPISLLSV